MSYRKERKIGFSELWGLRIMDKIMDIKGQSRLSGPSKTTYLTSPCKYLKINIFKN
jgi:hypothetical protein